MISTPVNLYQCDNCGKQLYTSDINQGKLCGCGSNRIKLLQYSIIRFIKALWKDSEIRSLYWNENLKKGKFNVYQAR